MKQSIIVHYHEISLKKGNRRWFEDRLESHLLSMLRDIRPDAVERFAGRMAIPLAPGAPVEEIIRRLKGVFGVANFALAWEVEAELEEIARALLKLLPAFAALNTHLQAFSLNA
jgi:thiamine biosynthesis protein ThiI